MKKTLIAALASLMLAGALCAADGATTFNSSATLVAVGDGCPLSVAMSPSVAVGDSQTDQF